MISIAVRNRSSLTEEGQLRDVVRAIARQCEGDLASVHRIFPPSIAYVGREETGAGDALVDLVDEGSVPDALGVHDETEAGMPWAQVYVNEIFRAGGTISKGAVSVSQTLSHEIGEMTLDPAGNLWADDYASGKSYAYEAFDAPEGGYYEIDGVAVSNFVLPAWFDARAASGSRFDWLGTLAAPFFVPADGYAIVRDPSTGRVSNIWGERFPEWKRSLKMGQASRQSRRIRAHARSLVGRKG